MKFAISRICSAFAATGVGTRVLDAVKFLESLTGLVEDHEKKIAKPAKKGKESKNSDVPGQYAIEMPEEDFSLVSAGVGTRDGRTAADYVPVEHRGQVGLYLRREHAAKVAGLTAIVYTRDAYLADPEVEETEKAELGDATHVVVAVLAAAGPKPPRTPFRLLSAIGGENNEFKWLEHPLDHTMPGNGTDRAKVNLAALRDIEQGCQKIVKEAKTAIQYDRIWCVVADDPGKAAVDLLLEYKDNALKEKDKALEDALDTIAKLSTDKAEVERVLAQFQPPATPEAESVLDTAEEAPASP